MDHIPLNYLLDGGPVMVPLLITSLIITYLIVERLLLLREERTDKEDFSARIVLLLKGRELDRALQLCDYSSGAISRIIRSVLGVIDRGREVVERVVKDASLTERSRLGENLSLIGILSTIAPLLGLLGTVSGMISTFRAINLYGTGDPEALAQGISQALITTQTGLIIGIPGILFYLYLSHRIDRFIKDIDDQLLKFVKSISVM